MIPGEYRLKQDPIHCNAGHEAVVVSVINTGDRPIQVGSHFHFFEVNKCLMFPREKALGMRMDLLAGTAKRFEPGEPMVVSLVPMDGAQRAFGANNLVKGGLDSETERQQAMERMREQEFKSGTHGF